MADPAAPPFLIPAGPLVGRDREQAALRTALAAALGGRGSLALVGGEAGIGKTALAEALCREAEARGALVLTGRAYDLAETPPYGPWSEVLAHASHGDDRPSPPDLAGGGGVANQVALFGQVGDYLAALAARRPLVLLLDDLHWADPASLDLLRHLGRGLGELPLLLLAAYRADEVTPRHPLYRLLPALAREARTVRLDLRPLEAEDLGLLLRARYGLVRDDEAHLGAYLAARTEGNPFFAGEILRTLEEERVLRLREGAWSLGDLVATPVPLSLRQVIDGRVTRLGEEFTSLLTVAALIGQEVPLDLWQGIAGREEEALLAMVEAAVEARLLVATEDGVRFAHALVREALYEAVLPPRRRAWHRRIGEALAATPLPDPDAVAHHLRRAGDPRAAAWLARAGERAQRAYAWLTAAERFAAALAVLEANGGDAGGRGWLTFRLAALRRFAAPRRALGDAERAGELAGEAGDRLLAAASTFVAGMLLGGYLGEPRRGIARMEAGLAALAALPEEARVPPGATAPLDPAPRRGTVVTQLAWSGRHAEALALGERYLAEVPAPAAADWLGGNPYADAHGGLGEVYLMLGQPARGRAALSRARELLRAVGHYIQDWLASAREIEGVVRYHADRPDELRRLLAEAAADQARARGTTAPAMAHTQAPQLLALAGDWTGARRAADAMLAAELPGTLTYGVASVTLGMLNRAQGETALARARVLEALPDGPETPPGDRFYAWATAMQRLGATLALDAGDLPLARAWLAAHDRWLAWGGAVLGRAEGQLGWATYHRLAGDLRAAREQAELALAQATEPRQPLALLAAHRLLGELATQDGRQGAATDHLDAALALAEACAAPYERALTLLARAEFCAATGRADEAQALLEEVRALCAPLRAAPALARAADLARRLGAPPVARPAGLSPREVDVLQLLASGKSNKEVAAALGLSVRTLERHIANLYAKIDALGRADAIAFAHRHGLL